MSAATIASRFIRGRESYVPDHEAPDQGEWDRSGPEPRWRQSHKALVAAAVRNRKGTPAEMTLHMRDEEEGAPEPGNGSGKMMRAMARALLWEINHKARPSPKPLFRGSHQDPKGMQSWSEKKSVAELWARKNNGQVFALPKGTKGLRCEDYGSSAFNDEKEWLVVGVG